MPLSLSIQLQGPSFAERLRRKAGYAYQWTRSKLLGAPLPSYQRSRGELGGVPWRVLDNTDGWFLVSAHSLVAGEATDRSEPAVEATPDLRTPLVSRRAVALVGAAGLFVASVAVLAARAPAPPVASQAIAVSSPPAAPTVAAPSPAAPTVAKPLPRVEAAASAHAPTAKVSHGHHGKRKAKHRRT